MFSVTTLIIVCLYASLSFAQTNITVVDTDPSIQYQGGAGDASLCKVDANGNILSQPGCYFVSSNCTTSVAMGQSKDSGASFKFQGSAIYINSLLFELSPLYTVNLDGTPIDVDGFRSSKPFICETLFSRTGLDPTVEHTISLTIKGVSPSSPGAQDPTVFDFSLINFIYTTENGTSSPSSSSAPATPSPSNTDTVNNANTTSNDTKTSSGTSMLITMSALTLCSLLVTMSTSFLGVN